VRTTDAKLGFLTAVALAACTALHAPHAAAQSRNAERCTTIDNDAERLACYDRALRPAAAPAPAPARSRAPAATASAPPPPATPSAVDPIAPAPSTPIATENRAARSQRDVRESTVSAPPVAPAAPAASSARKAPAAADGDTAGIVPIVIVQIRALPGRAATFVSDKGETWVQTDTQRQLPTVPFKASIKPGSLSSFFLVPDDYAHSFRVRPGQ